MTQDLGSAVGCDRMCEEKSFTLITQVDKSDANFLCSYFLIRHLNAGRPVCLLTVSHTFHHFVNAASKFGLNLRLLQDQGRLLVIDTMKTVNDQLLSAGSLTDPPLDVRALYGSLLDMINRCVGQHFAVVVDDLSALVKLGVPVREVYAFVQRCRIMCRERGCLVATVCRNRNEEDVEVTQLCRLLTHDCDVNLTVAELRSGFSNSVHGEMEIWWKNRSLKLVDSKIVKHFKIEDKKVIVFAPGTSSAVL